jgi:hypothetical protein
MEETLRIEETMGGGPTMRGCRRHSGRGELRLFG